MIVIAAVLGLPDKFLRELNIKMPTEHTQDEDYSRFVRIHDEYYKEFGHVSMHTPGSSSGDAGSVDFGGSSSDSGGGGGDGWSRF